MYVMGSNIKKRGHNVMLCPAHVHTCPSERQGDLQLTTNDYECTSLAAGCFLLDPPEM